MTKKADKVELLETQDIYDFYGCEFLMRATHALRSDLEPDERDLVLFRIDEIHEKYVVSVRERIKAELIFCGVSEIDIDKGFTIKSMLREVDKVLEQEITKQSGKMMFGNGFDMMSMMVNAHTQSGGNLDKMDQKKLKALGFDPKKEEVAPKDTTVQDNMEEGFFNNPAWQTIASAFLSVEEAITVDEKLNSVDHLNDLQHNSFHLLIDLQTGRMLEGSSEGGSKGKHDSAVKVLDEVLNLKHDARSPKEFAGKMSAEIGNLIKQCT
jgi:hypothetical protein